MAETAQRIERRRDPSYAEDWSAWVWRQVDLLNQRRFDELDLENLTDEVGSLARSDFRGWTSAIRLVLMNMLKWDHQPTHRSVGWAHTIGRERLEIEERMEASPSYAGRIEEAVTKAYGGARLDAAKEAGRPLRTFPEACPYDWTAITTRAFELPDETA